MCIQNLKTLALIEAQNFVTENLLGAKEKSTNKAMISSSRLILFHTIQKVKPNICTKFQIPRRSSSWEICWHKFPYVLHWRERWKKGKGRQKLITKSWFSFSQQTWPLSRYIQNLKTLAVIRAENSVTKSFIGEKEKWTNKGNDKQQHADSLLHNTTSQSKKISNDQELIQSNPTPCPQNQKGNNQIHKLTTVYERHSRKTERTALSQIGGHSAT